MRNSIAIAAIDPIDREVGWICILLQTRQWTASNGALYKWSNEVQTCTPVRGDGDINCDGSLNIGDALLIAKTAVAENPEDKPDTGCEYGNRADVDLDGEITLLDALLVAYCSVGVPTVACPAWLLQLRLASYLNQLGMGLSPPTHVYQDLLDIDGDGQVQLGEALYVVVNQADYSMAAYSLALSMLTDPQRYDPTLADDDEWVSFPASRPSGEWLISEQDLAAALVVGAPVLAPPAVAVGIVGLSVVGVLALHGLIPGDFDRAFIQNTGGELRSVSDLTLLGAIAEGESVVVYNFQDLTVTKVLPNGSIVRDGNEFDLRLFSAQSVGDQLSVTQSLLLPLKGFGDRVRNGNGTLFCAAHHIVPKLDDSVSGAAERAREVFWEYGIGLHDPANGALLGILGHRILHNDLKEIFYGRIDFQLRQQRDAGLAQGLDFGQIRSNLIAALRLEAVILEGEFPCPDP